MQPLAVLIFMTLFFVFCAAILSQFKSSPSLKNIKSKKLDTDQFGNEKFADKKMINQMYSKVLFDPKGWRKNQGDTGLRPGIVVGQITKRNKTYALVENSDVHAMMLGASGAGKTTFFLYPNIEYALASGTSILVTDTKGDVYKNYAGICEKYYGYKTCILDLRNPSYSDGHNIMGMVNMYMDMSKKVPKSTPEYLTYKSKAEKYAKIIAKTIIAPTDKTEFGANSFFYDASEGLLTSSILLVSEFCPDEYRHIVSVYKIIQDMMSGTDKRKSSEFSKIMKMLPENHKARWFAGAALNASDQGMAAVLSTAMSKLNSFLDTELEQIICFDSCIDTEKFCSEKTAVFIVLPEEDNTKHFIVSLIVQQMYREILTYADELGGKLNKKVLFFLDEFGSIPKISSAEMMFSASRSRGLGIVAIIQSFAQLEKNYGTEGCSIICDNTQLTIFGGLAPSSSAANKFSESLGKETIQSGHVTLGNSSSTSYSMIEHSLLSPVELRRLERGVFIIMKSGSYSMKSKLKLFKDWGIEFDCPRTMSAKATKRVCYASKNILQSKICEAFNKPFLAEQMKEQEKNQQLTFSVNY